MLGVFGCSGNLCRWPDPLAGGRVRPKPRRPPGEALGAGAGTGETLGGMVGEYRRFGSAGGE